MSRSARTVIVPCVKRSVALRSCSDTSTGLLLCCDVLGKRATWKLVFADALLDCADRDSEGEDLWMLVERAEGKQQITQHMIEQRRRVRRAL